MSERHSWWKIVVGADGKVKSCVAVEYANTDTSTVIYVRAANRAEAGRKAWAVYTLELQRRRRNQLVQEGRCPWCSRKQDRGAGKRCSICLSSHKADTARSRARARGEDVATPDRSASIAKRARDERSALRLGVLREVEAAWLGAHTSASFSEWLRSQIEAITGRRVA